MIEKKINNLKNIIFIKTIICILSIAYGFYLIFIVNDELQENRTKMEMIPVLITETKIKLNEITNNQSNVIEGIEKYNDIFNKTEEEKCKEYDEVLIKIGNLGAKHNLDIPLTTSIQNKPSRINFGHNKTSYISVYDIAIEFDASDFTKVFEIYSDILSLLPEYSIIYFTDIKEVSSTVPRRISSSELDVKPSSIRCKIGIKMRDIMLTKNS